MQVLCNMVSADVERQAWLFQAGALRMLHRLTLARAAQRQRSSSGGGTADHEAIATEGGDTEASESVSPGLRKEVQYEQEDAVWSDLKCRCDMKLHHRGHAGQAAIVHPTQQRTTALQMPHPAKVGAILTTSCPHTQAIRLLALLSTDASSEPALHSAPWLAFLRDAAASDDCTLASDAGRALLNMRSAAAAAAATSAPPPAAK